MIQCRYNTGMLKKYGTRDYNHLSKRDSDDFLKWLSDTYPHRYKDVKEGDYFILWNGSEPPIAFIQLRGEVPDKYNRPTRLRDGSYLSIDISMRLRISTKEEVIQLNNEVKDLEKFYCKLFNL